MSEYLKANSDHWYFVTMTVVNWIDIFTKHVYSDIIIESLKYCQENKNIRIAAYVIMPNHLHLLIQRDSGDLGSFFRDFKSYTAKRIISEIENSEQFESRRNWLLHLFKFNAKFKTQNKKYQFWQKTNHPEMILSNKFFNQKKKYIHQNPVKARIVTAASCYTYSSANPFQPIKLCI